MQSENSLYTTITRFSNFKFDALTHAFILANCTDMPDTGSSRFFTVQPVAIVLNAGSFNNPGGGIEFPTVLVEYSNENLLLGCSCGKNTVKMCSHQTQVLYNIMERSDLRIFFDTEMRHKAILRVAAAFGLEKEAEPDDHFELKWNNKLVDISPKIMTLQPVNETAMQRLKAEIFPEKMATYLNEIAPGNSKLIVFGEHKYYKHLQIGFYQAPVTGSGKIKNPLKQLDPQEYAWQANEAAAIKFFTGIGVFVNNHDKSLTEQGLLALKAIVVNPLAVQAFYHNATISETMTAASLVPVQLDLLKDGLELNVFLKGDFFEISGQLMVADKTFLLNNLPLKFGAFILAESKLHLVANLDMLRVMNYFKKCNNIVVVHKSKFDEFRKTILAKLEDKIRINYSWLEAATPEQLEENGFDQAPQCLIYLSDGGQYVVISPVMCYGEVEVSVLSKRQLYARDQKGNAFLVERDDVAEDSFTALLLHQHPAFEAQTELEYQDSFHLTKKQFLEDAWFLEAFETWGLQHIKVLGFNEISKNKLNQHKGKVSVKVTSGLDWFNTDLQVRYGGQKASLRHLHKSLKNGSKYVTLDDGTLGLLPDNWVKQMKSWFDAAGITGEELHTPKISFASVASLYEKEMLDEGVADELENYKTKLTNFEKIEPVLVPDGLQTTLRYYQQQGLNWLNFLDDAGFGGCLADDMGLGKTIQAIAFMLLLKQKYGEQTHLVVVPTSLIFNWQDELEKWAPSLKVLTIHGQSRPKNNSQFHQYDVVLTSYGMLVSCIHFIKTYRFAYIFLDESQAIKNSDSQRYKACRLLQSKNKIVITGTPVENNTYDLYGQLSFACPGLLGNQQYFKDIYAQPIDKFGDSKRAVELQQKVHPFILRRTKKQVAADLPEKTEMIIYCEMGDEQRKVYDAYEREFRQYLLHMPEEDLPRDSMHVLQGLTKLRQICNSPALLSDVAYYGDVSAKIAVLTEQIQRKHKDHKILVFSQFVGMLDLIRKELAAKYIPYEYLTGQTKDRAAAVANFQNNDDVRVFLISLKAGGTGLNLTEADYVYLVDPWWNPAVENQAIDRSHRIGQGKHVVAVRLICPGTIEEKMVKLQAAKKELINDLIKTDTGVFKQLSKQDLISLISNTHVT